ncbi:ExbD/TolR family protein [Roseovarius tibetensis]|uniref:ExbD/TolR family protein n=1 Tax=Roseovarius tibetensis TaxID=2685897 RepID=UPI003D7F9828
MRWRTDPAPRRLTRPRPPEDADARILPLINIVFLLLIFFMVAGRLSTGDPFEVAPPEAASADTARLDGVEILMGPTGDLALDGQEMDRAALLDRLGRRLRATPDLPVRLRADRTGEARALVAVLQALRGLGAREVTLITLPADR